MFHTIVACAYVLLILLIFTAEPCVALEARAATDGKHWKSPVDSISDASARRSGGRDDVCVSFKDAVCAEQNRREFVQVISTAFGQGYQSVIAAFFGGRRSVSDPFPGEPFLRQSFLAMQTMTAPEAIPKGFPHTLWLHGPYGSDAINSNCPSLTSENDWDVCLVYFASMGGQPDAQAHITLSHTLNKEAFREEFKVFLDTLVAANQVASLPSLPRSSSSFDQLTLQNSKLHSELRDTKTRLRKVAEEDKQEDRENEQIEEGGEGGGVGGEEVEPMQRDHTDIRQRLFLLGVASLIFGGSLYGASFFGKRGRSRSISIDCSVGAQDDYFHTHHEKKSPSTSPPRSTRALERSDNRRRPSPTNSGGKSPPGGVVRFLRRYSAD
jgi:hypothetical protein